MGEVIKAEIIRRAAVEDCRAGGLAKEPSWLLLSLDLPTRQPLHFPSHSTSPANGRTARGRRGKRVICQPGGRAASADAAAKPLSLLWRPSGGGRGRMRGGRRTRLQQRDVGEGVGRGRKWEAGTEPLWQHRPVDRSDWLTGRALAVAVPASVPAAGAAAATRRSLSSTTEEGRKGDG